MRILLDNCVPWRLGLHIVGHDVTSVVDLGWTNLDDGAVLDRMEGRFDVFLTVDKSIPYQQTLEKRSFAVVLLRSKSNKIEDLMPLVPALLQTLRDVTPGHMKEVN